MPSNPYASLSLSRPASPYEPYTYDSNSNTSDFEPPSPGPGRRFNATPSPSSFQNLKNFLLPVSSSNAPSANASASASLANTPAPSRPTSPVHYTGTSDDETSGSPLLGNTFGMGSRSSTSSSDSWGIAAGVPLISGRGWRDVPRQRKRRQRTSTFRGGWRRALRKIIRHPLFPTQPLTIVGFSIRTYYICFDDAVIILSSLRSSFSPRSPSRSRS